ncbi:septal ring lytic transglycosylase RlpA family protein [Leptolyngbya sp. AN03gr2]|uniref:septal ring lytic transglycosylase RlpA family protein n=1 Tax=unclassified Leptolyngbya TaxID=2650499 RepID=UPI003D31742C
MNQKLISGLTAALLATSTIGVASVLAESTPAANQGSTESETPRPSSPQSRDVVKLGEQQNTQAEDSIATIHSHEVNGRKAATLYVRNIPVLTFVGQSRNSASEVKVGEVQATPTSTQAAKLKYGATTPVQSSTQPRQNSSNPSQDPIARATAIAARLNQLERDGVDASKITVRWNETKSGDQFVIEANKKTIVAVDPQTMLPDTTRNPEQDALQVANRLRRLLGNAEPLRAVANRPRRAPQEVALGPVRFRVTGMASWYGPGFHGNMSASGERFNQNALTAAHRTLPFGTVVQVTNLDNGRTVSVRINDRGPFSGGRVIDLSAGAARVLGLIDSGVAPVRLEIRDSRRVAGN